MPSFRPRRARYPLAILSLWAACLTFLSGCGQKDAPPATGDSTKNAPASAAPTNGPEGAAPAATNPASSTPAAATDPPAANPSATATTPPATPPDKSAETPFVPEKGFGGDLKTVLAESGTTLEKGDVRQFVARLFPPAAAARFAAADQQEALVQQLKATPELASRMVADLKALAEQTPELTDDGTVANFQLAPEEGPARTVKFQKIGDDWRLFDGAAPASTPSGE